MKPPAAWKGRLFIAVAFAIPVLALVTCASSLYRQWDGDAAKEWAATSPPSSSPTPDDED